MPSRADAHVDLLGRRRRRRCRRSRGRRRTTGKRLVADVVEAEVLDQPLRAVDPVVGHGGLEAGLAPALRPRCRRPRRRGRSALPRRLGVDELADQARRCRGRRGPEQRLAGEEVVGRRRRRGCRRRWRRSGRAGTRRPTARRPRRGRSRRRPAPAPRPAQVGRGLARRRRLSATSPVTASTQTWCTRRVGRLRSPTSRGGACRRRAATPRRAPVGLDDLGRGGLAGDVGGLGLVDPAARRPRRAGVGVGAVGAEHRAVVDDVDDDLGAADRNGLVAVRAAKAWP